MENWNLRARIIDLGELGGIPMAPMSRQEIAFAVTHLASRYCTPGPKLLAPELLRHPEFFDLRDDLAGLRDALPPGLVYMIYRATPLEPEPTWLYFHGFCFDFYADCLDMLYELPGFEAFIAPEDGAQMICVDGERATVLVE